MSLHLDKSGWTRVAFGDVIESVTERVDDPSDAGVDRYVGLEHLDPGVLTVQRWDSPDKVQAQKLRFSPGDVIFGRRRAYQKKVAMAEFDGICSAHALVLRAKPGLVDPDFLPFFLASDYFLDRAISISVGSLSPTINWRDLKVQEFVLPPLDEQARLADLLWAVENAIRTTRSTTTMTVAARNSLLDSRIDELVMQHAVPFKSLWARSPESGWSAAPVDSVTGRYALSLAALGPSGYRRGQLKNVPDSTQLTGAILRPGDLLISRANTLDTVGRVGIFDEERDDVAFPDTMMRLSLVDDVAVAFAASVLSSGHGRRHMRRTAAGSATSMVKINRTTLGRLAFPRVSLRTQQNLLDELQVFDVALTKSEQEEQKSTMLKARLLANVFGGV